jgi:capsular exopolysaccharide synthesis family protein
MSDLSSIGVNDAGQIIRRYLTVARRQWWVIAQAAVIVGIAAGFMATRVADSPYRSSTTLFVDLTDAGTNVQQSAIRLTSKGQQVYNPAVLQAAAATLPGETAASIAAAIRSVPEARSGTITITATAFDPARPAPIANAMALAFINDQRAQQTSAQRENQVATQARIDGITTRLTEIDRAAAAAGIDVAKDNSTKAQRDALITQLSEAYRSLETINSSIATADPGITILFAAAGSSRPAKPNPLSRGLQGAAVGLMIGIALAALREALDTRLRDRAAIEAVLPWPTIGELVMANNVGRSLVTHEHPTGPIAEAMRRLRTNIRFLGDDDPIRSVVVTSALPGDGKTFVAANLAVSYAQLGLRTVLVSGDLRRPSLDAFFLPRTGRGLSDVLSTSLGDRDGEGRHTTEEWAPPPEVEQLLRYTGIPNLWLLPAGAPQRNPAELLSAEHAHKLFDQLALVAEMIIIDAPPLVVVDPVLLGSMADGLLLVASMRNADRASVRRAREVLEASNGRVLGLVLNRMPERGDAYSYGYYGPPSDESDRPRKRKARR